MSVIEQLKVILDLDDKGFRVRMQGAVSQLDRFRDSVDRTARRMMRMERSMRGFTATTRDWTLIIGQARNAMQQLYMVFGAMPTAIIRVNAEIERMTKLLEGISTEGTAAMKALDAERTLDVLFDKAKQAPFAIGAITDSMVKFKSVGLDPLDGSMDSLIDAVAAFGGTDETLKRASIAIQQMGGKGVISMEELRQQLGEAVPQAITIMAQTLGVSYGELVDKISKGQVKAEPALKAMFRGFNLVFGGRAAALMNTFNGRVAVLNTNMKELVTQTPGMRNFFNEVSEIVGVLGDIAGGRAAREIANNIGNLFAGIGMRVRAMIEQSTVAYGKVATLFRILMRNGSTEGTLLHSFLDVIKQIMEFSDRAGESVKKELFGDDYMDRLLEQRMLDGEDLGADEMDTANRIYNERLDELEEARERRDRLLAALNDPVNEKNAAFALEMSSENFEARQTEEEARGEIARLKARRAEVRSELLALREDYSHHGEEMKLNYQAELTELDYSLEQERRRLNQALETQREYNRKKTELAQRSKEASQAGPRYDAFGDVLPPESAIDSMKGSLASLAPLFENWRQKAVQSFKDAQEEVENLEGVVNGLAGSLNNEISDESDALLADWKDKLSEMQLEFGTQNADMLSQMAEIMEDTALSQEERFRMISDLAASVAADQIQKVTDLGEVAQAELQSQGAAGIEAAAAFAKVVLSLIASIRKASGETVEGVKGGITLTGGKKGGSGGGQSKSARAMDRLKDMIEDANREADELREKLINPFAYELPKAVDRARDKIDKLARDISGGQWTQEMKNLFDKMATNAVTEELIKMKEATRGIQRSLMGERAARREVYDEEVRNIRSMKEKLIEMGLWRLEWEKIIQEQLLALREQYESQSPLGQFRNEWREIADDIEQVGVDAVKSLSQGIADFVTEGKADFADLARSAVNSLIQISTNAAFSMIFDKIMGSIGGSIGGSARPKATPGVGIWHEGGIVGTPGRSRSVNSALFANAPRFHTGGVVGKEVPIIANRGEGVFTEEQMKAIGKGMSKPSGPTRVNIINESGVPMEQAEASERFDGEGMVLDVVLSAAGRPGKFRDSLKEVLK